MKRPSWTLTILIIIVLVAIFTNPSTDEHKQAVKSIFNQYIIDEISEEENNDYKTLGLLMGNSLATNIIENSVTRENYIIFSITKISWKGENKSIGYGVFGNIFLSEKIKKSFSEKSNYNSEEFLDEKAVELDSLEY